jgi:hypothetical protein
VPVSRFTGFRLGLSLALLLSGCTPRLIPVQPPVASAAPPRQVFRIYAGAAVAELHGVQWTADSVRGVPYFRPLACDTCRITLARTAIDSVKQVQGREALGMLAAALPLAAIGVLAASFSSLRD